MFVLSCRTAVYRRRWLLRIFFHRHCHWVSRLYMHGQMATCQIFHNNNNDISSLPPQVSIGSVVPSIIILWHAIYFHLLYFHFFVSADRHSSTRKPITCLSRKPSLDPAFLQHHKTRCFIHTTNGRFGGKRYYFLLEAAQYIISMLSLQYKHFLSS